MSDKSSNSMWGGRFDQAPDDIMTQINASIDVDQRLWREDIQGSIAHAEMLSATGIIPSEDAEKIITGLKQVGNEIEAGDFTFSAALEDIHMNVENRLKEIIGDVAGKLHTARSRNDQVATDFRLWTRTACDSVITKIENLQNILQKICDQNITTIMPGFTHLQVAQPITLAMHLDAYIQMLERDQARTSDCRKRVNQSPLGACALSGTGFKNDRDMTAKSLNFDQVMTNTLDAVSARDFANEFLFVSAQIGAHLSRLAEEIIIWATPQFGFVTLSDTWSTGSSIMPQKKNPDAAELIRAKTGRLNGNLMQMLTVMKALPLAYNKDMQEDKTASFESFDTICLCLDAMAGMMASMTFHPEKMAQTAEDGYATATEIADWLVRELQMPFRQAHHATGAIVKYAEMHQLKLSDVPLEVMQEIEPAITSDLYQWLDPKKAVASRLEKA